MTIDQLKTELREFIALSETITPGPWEHGNDGDMVYRQPRQFSQAAGIIIHGRNSGVSREQDERDAAFIARSRNISPKMAKMLLVAVESLDRESKLTPLTSARLAQETLQQLLKLWEETM